ncbi:Pdp3-interacting factor 1 [Penicillium argentinense]|uniref:Pdp3-interacting factor 1 n=1 Tax=Penicillium argentinense TaxID=1131581 RepID=A0A9W9EIK4_9EURO|nr:Pdp3-interacting factor 1 [Penicillium argentinense]KAJ5082482.1 Pdp3-interacting factor 1 [Penicillium argentinense]
MTNGNMKPTQPTPPQKRKIIIFSDFDGTICMQDTGHILVDAHGCGAIAREKLEEQMKSGSRTFRDVSEEMWASLHVPFDDGFVLMEKSIEIDPGFKEFHQYCVENGFPFNVISAGLKPILRRVLDTFLGEKESSSIDIVANDAEIPPDGSQWKPIWRHDSVQGHDKDVSVNEARLQAQAECEPDEMPLIIFIGDGVSDLAAAREADVLFARHGLRLEQHCQEHNIPYIPFTTFSDIKREIEKISKEDQKKTGGVGKPVRYNPRANMWRRISSKEAVPTLMAAATPSNEEKMFLWPETFSDYKPKTIQEDQEPTAA